VECSAVRTDGGQFVVVMQGRKIGENVQILGENMQILFNFGCSAAENVGTKLSRADGATKDLNALLSPRNEISIQHEKSLSIITGLACM
jgi:hypothetical protein